MQYPATTGMQYLKTKNYNFLAVADFIMDQAKKYGGYRPDAWDSFDLSCLVAADVRYRFPGQPIGILQGIAKEGGPEIVGRPHYINILWFEQELGDGKKEWYARYFDATICSKVREFEINAIMPIPISGLTDHNELLPLENIKFLDRAAFVLDRIYQFELIDEVKKKMIEWKNKNPQKGHKFEPAYYTYNDRVFYWFAHLRYLYKGAPIGAVFGKVRNADYAALILWDYHDTYRYWDIIKARDVTQSIEFEPRVLIV